MMPIKVPAKLFAISYWKVSWVIYFCFKLPALHSAPRHRHSHYIPGPQLAETSPQRDCHSQMRRLLNKRWMDAKKWAKIVRFSNQKDWELVQKLKWSLLFFWPQSWKTRLSLSQNLPGWNWVLRQSREPNMGHQREKPIKRFWFVQSQIGIKITDLAF